MIAESQDACHLRGKGVCISNVLLGPGPVNVEALIFTSYT